ncbi:MAG: DUF2905 domain-containing protein [Chloroflexi bacterium]|nr:DUF2905 domain-containing protein [Chloroflexota bacterium]
MAGFSGIGKFLIIAGLFLILSGLLVTFWPKIPFLGKLPGDIVIQKDGFRLFFPLATGLVISLLLSLLLNLVFRISR